MKDAAGSSVLSGTAYASPSTDDFLNLNTLTVTEVKQQKAISMKGTISFGMFHFQCFKCTKQPEME